MEANLALGFRGRISVTDLSGQTLYEKEISNNTELTDFVDRYGYSNRSWGLLRSSVCPIYRDSAIQLAADILCPTLVNFALRVQSIVMRIFAMVLAAAFDLATLPIRIIATPLSLGYRQPDSPHALTVLVQGEHKKIMGEWARINYSTENMEQLDRVRKQEVVNGSIQVAVKTIPYNLYDETTSTNTILYTHSNGQWVEGFIPSSSGEKVKQD